MKPILCALLSFAALTARGQYTLDWSKIAGGGGASSNAPFALTGTIGQPDAGRMSGGGFNITGGFWAILTVVQTPGSPTLYITNAGPGQAVIWWSPSTTGFKLQHSPALGTGWTDSQSGTNNPVSVSIGLPARYYRLTQP